MGCYNSTCMITHLPILWKDPVVAVALRPFVGKMDGSVDYSQLLPDTGGGYCLATDAFIPFPVPVRGRYDDYGGIEEIAEGEATQIIEELTGKSAIQFFDEAERIKETNRRGDYCLALIREEVWDALLKLAPDISGRLFTSLVAEPFQHENFQGWGDTFLQQVAEESLKTLQKWSGKGEDKPRPDYWDLRQVFLMRLDELEGAREACSEMVRISYMLERLRRGWTPQYGMGGQDAEWADYLCLNRLVHKIIKEKMHPKEWKELTEG